MVRVPGAAHSTPAGPRCFTAKTSSQRGAVKEGPPPTPTAGGPEVAVQSKLRASDPLTKVVSQGRGKEVHNKTFSASRDTLFYLKSLVGPPQT